MEKVIYESFLTTKIKYIPWITFHLFLASKQKRWSMESYKSMYMNDSFIHTRERKKKSSSLLAWWTPEEREKLLLSSFFVLQRKNSRKSSLFLHFMFNIYMSHVCVCICALPSKSTFTQQKPRNKRRRK